MILVHTRTSGKVKIVDVFCAMFLNNRNDILAQSGEDGRDRDCRHHADHNAQDSEKAAKLVSAHAIKRHPQRFFQHSSWKLESHYRFDTKTKEKSCKIRNLGG